MCVQDDQSVVLVVCVCVLVSGVLFSVCVCVCVCVTCGSFYWTIRLRPSAPGKRVNPLIKGKVIQSRR